MNIPTRFLFGALALAMAHSAHAQTMQLKAATISAGAARLGNGSLVNLGQTPAGTFGTPGIGISGRAGIDIHKIDLTHS